MTCSHDITVYKPPLSVCMHRPLPLVAQLEMRSCSVAGEKRRPPGRVCVQRTVQVLGLVPVSISVNSEMLRLISPRL